MPVFGISGYLYSWRKLYPDFLGVNLDIKYALDLWLQGTFFIMLGIYLTYIIKRTFLKYRYSTHKPNTYISWDWKRFNLILFLLVGISLIFTIATLSKIGYIPILKGNVALERFSYAKVAGDWTFKLGRLWLLVYLFTFIKLLRNIKSDKCFYVNKNLFLIILLIFSFILEGIYLDRFIQFIMIMFSIIMINRTIGKIKVSHIVLIFLVFLFLAHSIVFIRDVDYRNIKTIRDKVLLNTFSEFFAFAYILKEYPERDFLHGKGFVGTFAPLLPKQLWAAFNLNKDELMSLNAAAVMAKIFGTYWGMRIGIIGEGFINFGYLGIVLIPLISGILFGILENIFIALNPFNVNTIIVSLAISILMFLPIAQSNTFLNIFVLNAYFIIGFIIFFHKKS